MKYCKVLLLCISLIFTQSCGAVKEGFSNQKKNNTDEFLVEKKSPLVLPPSFNELPIPKSDETLNENKGNQNKIEELVTNDTKKDNSQNESTNLSFEESLLEKIRKN